MVTPKRLKRIAYYITPHGFGHAIRSLEVIRHLLNRAPDLEITIVSTIPHFLVQENLGRPLATRRKTLDIGLVQKDSVQFDLEASLKALETLWRNRDTLLADELSFLHTGKIQGIICDIPFLPFAAASGLNLPTVGLGNFTWDWIYQSYAYSDHRWRPLISWIRNSYKHCGLFLQLPMHGDCSACPNIQNVPLIARPARRKPDEIRQTLGLHPADKAYLVSFTALDLDEKAQRYLKDMRRVVFLYKRPLRLNFGICLDTFDLAYRDIVAAVDAVISKPGYGIVADCLANGTALIYTDRGSFPEYDILVREMRKHLATSYIPPDDLYSGRWESAIKELEKQSRTSPQLTYNGAEISARKILSYFDGES